MKKFFFVIFFFTLILFVSRSILYFEIEPTGDFSFFIWWIDGILNSDHILPLKQNNYNFIDSIKIDKFSLTHAILLPIYSSITNLFTVISLTYFSLGNIFFEKIVSANIVLSVLANSLSIFIVSAYFYLMRNEFFNLKKIIILGFLYISLISISSFFSSFSTQGPHNLGILFLYLSLFFFKKYFYNLNNKKSLKKSRSIFLLFVFLAFYSMYTNIFLIPTLMFFSIFFFSNLNMKEKIFEILKLFFFTFIILMPGVIALIITEYDGQATDKNQGFFAWSRWAFKLDQENISDVFTTYAKFNFVLIYIFNNIKYWLYYNIDILGKYNFLIALAGIILFKIKYKDSLILSLLISHLFISSIMWGFNEAASRTYAYLIPLLYFGITIFCFELYILFQKIKIKYFKFFLTLFSLIIIFTYQIKLNFSKFLDPSIFNANWSGIYKKDNKKVWKNLSDYVVSEINEKAIIVTQTSVLKYQLKNQINNDNYSFFASLDVLNIGESDLKLSMYKFQLEKEIKEKYPIYFLVFEENEIIKNKSKIKQTFCNLNKENCNKEIVFIKNIKGSSTFWKEFYIFRL
jgi:hypothetical protein